MSWYVWLIIGILLGYVLKDILPFPDIIINNQIKQRGKGNILNFFKRKLFRND